MSVATHDEGSVGSMVVVEVMILMTVKMMEMKDRA